MLLRNGHDKSITKQSEVICMKLKKILALSTAAILALSLTACGEKKDEADDTTAAPETTLALEIETLAEDTTAAAEESSAADDTTTAAPEATEAAATEAASEAPTEAATEEENKVPQTKQEIVDFYKKAANATGKINANDKMELKSLDGGSGVVGGLLSAFEPIAKNALAKNSGSVDEVTGGYQNLSADDVSSASATSDGKTTSVRINLKQQVDGMNGKKHEGHVGHGVTILDGVQKAIDELNGVSVDPSEGSIKLTYNDAYIDVKIDNETGKIVSGKWHYKVDINIDNTKVKIGFISATLNGATGAVDYQVTM